MNWVLRGGPSSWGLSQSPGPSVTSTELGGTRVGLAVPCCRKSFSSPAGVGRDGQPVRLAVARGRGLC